MLYLLIIYLASGAIHSVQRVESPLDCMTKYTAEARINPDLTSKCLMMISPSAEA